MASIAIKMISPIIVSVAQLVLKSLAKHVWEYLWIMLIDSIHQVEVTIKNDPDLKKETVIRRVTEYIKANKKLSKIQLWAVEKFIDLIIDKMIDQMNNNYGHDWIKTITDLKKYWENRIPYLN